MSRDLKFTETSRSRIYIIFLLTPTSIEIMRDNIMACVRIYHHVMFLTRHQGI